MIITVPVRTQSITNQRIHHMKLARQKRSERDAVSWSWRQARPQVKLPMVVKLTRVAPRELDDDNLVASCKAVRDQIAAELDVDDRDKRIKWEYAQRKGKTREYAVEIEVLEVE